MSHQKEHSQRFVQLSPHPLPLPPRSSPRRCGIRPRIKCKKIVHPSVAFLTFASCVSKNICQSIPTDHCHNDFINNARITQDHTKSLYGTFHSVHKYVDLLSDLIREKPLIEFIDKLIEISKLLWSNRLIHSLTWSTSTHMHRHAVIRCVDSRTAA